MTGNNQSPSYHPDASVNDNNPIEELNFISEWKAVPGCYGLFSRLYSISGPTKRINDGIEETVWGYYYFFAIQSPQYKEDYGYDISHSTLNTDFLPRWGNRTGYGKAETNGQHIHATIASTEASLSGSKTDDNYYMHFTTLEKTEIIHVCRPTAEPSYKGR